MVNLAEVLTHVKDIKDIVETFGTVAGVLGSGLSHLKQFVPGNFPWPGKSGVETMKVEDIEKFKKTLLKGNPLYGKPQRVTVEGTFYRASLLSSGWWERNHEAKIPDFRWKNGLQEWLYRGFEEWAPSWDINPSSDDKISPYLFGQIGARDEASSLPVIIPGEKGKMVGKRLEGKVVFEAEVTGLLYHRSQLPAGSLTKLGQYGKAFDYCILLNEEDNQHKISDSLGKKITPYSGYLWQCWGPKEWLVGMKTPRLDEVYFLWEHTDLTKSDALEYNIDSLNHKAEYLLKTNPDLILLQKSSSVVPGQPACPSELFYQYILGKEAAA